MYLKKRSHMPLYKAWDVKRETRKAVAAESFEEFAKAGELFQEKEKTNSGYKHNKKVSHDIINLTFRMLQHTSPKVTVTRYDEI